MSHAGSAVGTARTRAVPRQPARMVLRFADLDGSSTCSLPSVGLHRPVVSQGWLCQRWWVRTDGSAPAAPAQCAMCRCRPTHRTDHGIDLEGIAAGATGASRCRRACPRRLGAAHAAAHRPHWPPCRSAAPTQSKRSRGFRCTRTGQRLTNAEAAAAGAQRYRAGTAPSPRST